MPVVTVTRQFGAGGSEVAARVATQLGWSLLDNAFIERAARGLGTTPAIVEALEERTPSLVERLATALALGVNEPMATPLPGGMPPTEGQWLEVARQLIEDAASREPVVVVGRGAQVILGDRADAFHVLCTAPRAMRVARVQEREQLSTAEASRLVDERNRQRGQFVAQHWRRDWLEASQYHLCVNTGWLGVPEAAALIADSVRWWMRDRG